MKELGIQIPQDEKPIKLEHGRAKYGAAFPEWRNDPNFSENSEGSENGILGCTVLHYLPVNHFIREEIMDTNK